MLSKKVKRIMIIALLVCSLFSTVAKASSIEITPFKLSESSITYVTKTELHKPRILLYHSHYCERYDDGTSVYDAGEDLKKKLEQQGFIVEHIKTDFSKDYNNSYRASRKMLLGKDLDKYSLVVDIHRDAGDKAVTTYINNKGVAKFMFVNTKQNPNRDNEIDIANNIVKNMGRYGEYLYRGMYQQYNVGISYYNADLSDHSLLLELGNLHNTKNEVFNTNTYLSEAISNYIINNNKGE